MLSPSSRKFLALLSLLSGLGAQQFEGYSKPKPVDIRPNLMQTGMDAEDGIPAPSFPTSDIDVDIPVSEMDRPDAVAVIVGISRYAHKDVPRVDYATRDAMLMREYLLQTLGFREENIIMALDEDATQATFNRIFEGQLANFVKPGISDVFVYYTGHGAPDLKDASAYFMPHDADPNYAAQTGYSLSRFYAQLERLGAQSVTVVIDACFSGASAGGMLIKEASPIFISVENPAANLTNGTILTSSSGDQISSWHSEVGHGLFTYYFLKGLRGAADGDHDRQVTSTELFAYISEHVPYLARRLFNREQTPQLMGGNLDQVLVKY